ncbi:MAG: aminotransferase class IV [Phycisphaerales bacterium]
MKVWLNGQFVNRDDATVSVHDAGLQHAVGLFETMRASGGRVYRVREHLQRLADSAKALRLTETLRPRPLAEAVETTVRGNDLDEARVRLTITGGDLNLLQARHENPSSPTIIIVAQPPTRYPDELFTKGVRVGVADGRLNPLDPFAGHKTINYWSRLRALQEAGAEGLSEALCFSVSNHLMSGSVSNVALVKEGALRTPFARGEEVEGALPSPVLPGITRAAVFEFAERRGIGVERSMLSIDDLLDADEVFLTNASWGVLPVVGVSFGAQSETIGAGSVGPITTTLREAWLEDVESRTQSSGGVEVESEGFTPGDDDDAME